MMFVLNVLCAAPGVVGEAVVARGAYNMADVIAIEDISKVPSREHPAGLTAVRFEGGAQVLCVDTFDAVLGMLQREGY